MSLFFAGAGQSGGEFRSMREVAKSVLLGVLRGLPSRGAGGAPTYRVLVLDHRATRVLSACLRMFDITQEGVALVESLEKARQPFPELEAVYVCEPSEESVRRLIGDFGDKASYARAHVFFLRHCPDEVLALVKAAPGLIRRTQTLTETNLDFLAVEDNVFHVDLDGASVELFNADQAGYKACAERLVDSLVTLCASLNEYPFVRYPSENALCSKLAMDFHSKFNSFVNGNTSFWWRGDGGDGHGDISLRATLLVLDRTEDLVAPLLHAFSYQSMVQDLLNVTDDVCRYYKGEMARYAGQDEAPGLQLESTTPDKGAEVGVALLNEDDAMWCEFRHLHVTKVIERLRTVLDKYMDTSIGRLNRAGTGQQASLEEMNKAIQELPEYQAVMEKHTQHVQITRLLMHKLTTRRLLECARVEQAMATGVDAEGKEVGAAALTADLMKLVKDPQVGALETFRLVALLLVTQRGIREEDRRLILDSANPPLDAGLQNALLNLGYLGAHVVARAGSNGGASTSTSTSHAPRLSKEALAEAKRVALTTEDQYGRYTPLVAQIVDKVCRRALPQDTYPYIIEPPLALPNEGQPQLFSAGSAAASAQVVSTFSNFFAANKNKPAGAGAPAGKGAGAAPTASPEGVVLSVRSKPAAAGAAAGAAQPGAAQPGTAPGQDNLALLAPAAPLKRSPKGSRIIVFVAGGCTAMELVALHNVMREHNRDVVVGTTNLLAPKQLVHALKFLDKGGAQQFYQERDAFATAKREAVQRRMAAAVAAAGAGAQPAQQQQQQPGQPEPAIRKQGGFFLCGCMAPPPEEPLSPPVQVPGADTAATGK